MFSRKQRKEFSSEAKEALNKAFTEMRKNNMYALQDHWCCSSCAGADIDSRFQKAKDEKKPLKSGYCFYHHQDKQGMEEYGEVYLAFGSFDEKDEYGTEMQGFKIVQILKKHGLKTTWDGQGHTRILVDMSQVETQTEAKEA